MMLSACGTAMQQAITEVPKAVHLTIEQQIESRLTALLERPVDLEIKYQKTYKQWTFWAGHPLNPDGSHIDIENTPFSADYAEGYFDDVFMALSQSTTNSGADKLVHFDYGATDAPFVSWAEQYNLSLCLFSQAQQCD